MPIVPGEITVETKQIYTHFYKYSNNKSGFMSYKGQGDEYILIVPSILPLPHLTGQRVSLTSSVFAVLRTKKIVVITLEKNSGLRGFVI